MIARARLLAPWVLCACAVTEDVASRRAPIIQGTVDPGDPGVVAIAARRIACNEPPPAPSCTGTLIHPRVVLTAAHCIEPEQAGVAYEVLFGATHTSADAKLRVVTARLRHPKYDAKTHAYDVALLRLADDAPVAPIAISTTPPIEGSKIRVVGYGLTEDPGVLPGTKRSGTMTVTTVEEASFRAKPSPSNTCRADSGGPVLGGTPETLLGVTVAGDPGCREYATNVRVDALGPMIDAFIKETDAIAKGPPAGIMSPEQICSVPCANAGDCPAALECQSTPSGRRCVLPGRVAGDFGTQCGPGMRACKAGSTCARLWTDGDFACLCHTPCPGGVIPPPTDAGRPEVPSGTTYAGGGGTCATGGGRSSSFGGWLTVLAAMAMFSRSRARRASTTE